MVFTGSYHVRKSFWKKNCVTNSLVTLKLSWQLMTTPYSSIDQIWNWPTDLWSAVLFFLATAHLFIYNFHVYMTVYAWWFMFIGWLIHPLDTTVLGCIPAYLPTRKIIDAFSYLLPRCPFERQERAKMLQKFKQHIDGISGPLEQYFTQHHLFYWKSSDLNLLGDDEDIGSKLNEKKITLCCKILSCIFASHVNLQLIMGSSKKSPNKNLPRFLPVAFPRGQGQVAPTTIAALEKPLLWRNATVFEETKKGIEVLEMLRGRKLREQVDSWCFFFFGEK